ncbi:MAG: DoxX family protein [Patescibacteria group bacterium]|nr:DoxX family protein [Patescibacteria group bacterium]MDE1940901.1 DoxX family protein [Patescibacteria group bacterium]MDE1966916.1 DoxX family protein [Patescibacteria group bacterium]
MTTIFFIGRLIFGFYWLRNGYRHFSGFQGTVAYASSKGVPAAKLAIIVTGLLLLAGGLSMVLGLWPAVGLVCLLVFLIPVTFKMHDYWNVADPNMKMAQSINFWKNIGLIGAVAMMFAISMPWPFSI